MRRERDLKYINNAFSTVLLVEKGLINQDEDLNLLLPRKIEVKSIEDTFYSIIDSLELNYREGVRSLLINIDAINKQLDCLYGIAFSGGNYSRGDLYNIHGQIVTYSYLVHQLNFHKESYKYNGMTNQELLDNAYEAFGVIC